MKIELVDSNMYGMNARREIMSNYNEDSNGVKNFRSMLEKADFNADADGVKTFRSKEKSKNESKSIAVLILGILSLFLGIIFAIIALVLGKDIHTTSAKIGRICSIITVILTILGLIWIACDALF